MPKRAFNASARSQPNRRLTKSRRLPGFLGKESSQNCNLSYFSMGSHMDDVIRLQGSPTSITKYDALKKHTWSYGSSRVELSTKDDRVIEWSNLDENLKVRP